MSSQGGSSVRTCSGVPFTPMSGDSLSREVSTPSTSSTEFAPKVASRPTSRRVTELVRETASTSSRLGKEEKNEVAVS